ncbi:hypothetical protein BJX70DRAFT_371840 [Aspergillus crustosus]
MFFSDHKARLLNISRGLLCSGFAPLELLKCFVGSLEAHTVVVCNGMTLSQFPKSG